MSTSATTATPLQPGLSKRALQRSKGAPAMPARPFTVALVGCPNVGKTTCTHPGSRPMCRCGTQRAIPLRTDFDLPFKLSVEGSATLRRLHKAVRSLGFCNAVSSQKRSSGIVPIIVVAIRNKLVTTLMLCFDVASQAYSPYLRHRKQLLI